ncbi:MAG: hypothetical protein RBU37_01640 [Myxococcota bacterium]|nr:hypothetical protein [Myxococcota bacterium]
MSLSALALVLGLGVLACNDTSRRLESPTRSKAQPGGGSARCACIDAPAALELSRVGDGRADS